MYDATAAGILDHENKGTYIEIIRDDVITM